MDGFAHFKPRSAPRALASAMEHEKDHMLYALSSRNRSANIVSIQIRVSSPATVTRSDVFY